MRELTIPETAQIRGGNFFAPLGVTSVLNGFALQLEVQAQMAQVVLELQNSMSGYDMSES